MKIEINKIYLGDCMETMRSWPENSVDAVVTDPPYGIRFMGNAWDGADINAMVERKKRKGTMRTGLNSGTRTHEGRAFAAGCYDLAPKAMKNFQAWSEAWAVEALRVLKPGGHLLSFASTRTYHRMTCGIEDAGFEIRDTISWLFGSGFPKSLNVGKMMDKNAGAERPVVGKYQPPGMDKTWNLKKAKDERTVKVFASSRNNLDITAAVTADAVAWDGWGTALKPANEPVVLARKPLSESTVAANVLKWGTGALNIGASRLDREDGDRTEYGRDKTLHDPKKSVALGKFKENTPYDSSLGRWPANILFDQYAAGFLDGKEQGASRFFYVAKPDAGERNSGLEGSEKREAGIKNSSGRGYSETDPYKKIERENFHPTVKPVDLMAYLIKLVTPPNGTVLDPFMGSGTTGIAAARLGFPFVGCEMSAEYLALAEKRIAAEQSQGKLF